MGGSDDPSNLVELTVEEHADAHKILYEKYGREEDKMAWLGLSGQASKKELVKLGQKLGRKKTDEFLEKKYGSDWRRISAKIAGDKGAAKYKQLYRDDPTFREQVMRYQSMATAAALSETSRNKRKETYSKNGHQQGAKNSNYGKMWIYNEHLKTNKCIPKEQPIPDGWFVGRKMKW
jgi:hypothetical protein